MIVIFCQLGCPLPRFLGRSFPPFFAAPCDTFISKTEFSCWGIEDHCGMIPIVVSNKACGWNSLCIYELVLMLFISQRNPLKSSRLFALACMTATNFVALMMCQLKFGDKCYWPRSSTSSSASWDFLFIVGLSSF